MNPSMELSGSAPHSAGDTSLPTSPSPAAGSVAAGRSAKPLFIPLKTEYFEAFKAGTKTFEYRRYGPRWNERTCPVGRPVVLSKGYGKQHRLTGVVAEFRQRYMATNDWLDCYGTPGFAACIRVALQNGSKKS